MTQLHYFRPVVQNEIDPLFVIEPADAMRRRLVNREFVPVVAMVTQEEDARLFTAASEMLETLRKCAEHLEGLLDDGAGQLTLNCLKEVEYAIYQATGKQR